MAVVDDVLRNWRVKAREVTKPEHGTMNEIFIVGTDSERLVLRGHRRVERPAVEFEHAVMDAARASDIPAPAALTTPGGDRIVGHDGRWWSLLRWLEGDQPERGSHTNEQAAAMGEMLARMRSTPVTASSRGLVP